MDRVTLRWGRGAEGTPAMPVGRCPWELSERKLHRNIKTSQPLRMKILYAFDEKHPKQVGLMGRNLGLYSACPARDPIHKSC